MSSKITKVMAIRVRNETADYFRDKPLNRIVESVHDLVKSKDVEIDKGQVKILANDSSYNKRQIL